MSLLSELLSIYTKLDDSPMTAYLPVTRTGWQFATCIWNLHPRYHVIRVMIRDKIMRVIV